MADPRLVPDQRATTHAAISPVIFDTYGRTDWSRSCVNALATRIDRREWDSRGREYMVMVTCWDWFSGGDTAASAARKIEAVLNSAPSDEQSAKTEGL